MTENSEQSKLDDAIGDIIEGQRVARVTDPDGRTIEFQQTPLNDLRRMRAAKKSSRFRISNPMGGSGL